MTNTPENERLLHGLYTAEQNLGLLATQYLQLEQAIVSTRKLYGLGKDGFTRKQLKLINNWERKLQLENHIKVCSNEK